MLSLIQKSTNFRVHYCSRPLLGSHRRVQQQAIKHAQRAKIGVLSTLHPVPAKIGWKLGAPVVLCQAEPGRQLSVTDLLSVLSEASNAWDKYDKDRNGAMSLKECENIFNSTEVSRAFEKLTNISHRNYNMDELESYFKRADKDSSGTLSRTEFLALYLAVVGDRIKRNPLLLAEVLLGFVDKDKNGVLEGRELKRLLLILGFTPALLMPIPGFMKIEYRAILNRIGMVLEGPAGPSSGKKGQRQA